MKKLVFGLMLLSVAACHPFELPDNAAGPDVIVDVTQKTMAQLNIPNGFTFQTTKSTTVRIEARDNAGNVLKNVAFDLFLKDKNEKDSVFLMSATTNTEGVFTTNINLESSAERLIAMTNYIGLPAYQAVNVESSNNINLFFGNENIKRNGVVYSVASNTNGSGIANGELGGSPNSPELSPEALQFTYMGRVNSEGVPTYLLPKGDVVSQDILNMINASLPEARPVPTYNPNYITTSTQTNIVLKDSAAVWITFVHEGAGYRNAVGYYSYPTNNPPKKVSDIAQMNVIFPNTSFVGSGGGLKTGDKVHLGNFSAGTTVGWFLVPDGWVPSQSSVTDSRHPVRFSDRSLNTFTTDAYRSHVVLLNDPARELLLIGFEDLDRPSGDNDFNDAVFYASVNPFTAVVKTNMATTRVYAADTDNDGIPDSQDDAPNDPTYAFTQFTPSVSQYGTLAFEDSYPSKGDYDMNDMVIDYQFEQRTNAANKVTQLRAKFVLRAMGASFRNGFGFELPIASDKVASVSGAKRTDNLITVNANGTESRQQNAVIIPFDNAYDILRPADGGFVNTEKTRLKLSPDTISMVINFKEPISVNELGTAPFNPFIFVNRERGREVHLAGNTPTSLANKALFGTADDDSGNGKYYQTKTNLPWAIHLPASFAYPVEKEPINKAYLKFNEWSESKGVKYADWYKTLPNYRDVVKIY
jgi:LruC domain-containing protein